MSPVYTETLYDYLKDQEEGYLDGIFANIPAWEYDGRTVSAADLFEFRNRYKEIGAETEERFDWLLRLSVQELEIAYAPKIDLYLSKLGDLDERTIDDEDITTSTDYLNPTTAGSVADETARVVAANKVRAQRQIIINAGTNAELIREVSELRDLYNEMIASLDKLFMGVH